jgi:hypothetical protein
MEDRQPTTNLEAIPALDQILSDMNKPYTLDVTHLHTEGEFLFTE